MFNGNLTILTLTMVIGCLINSQVTLGNQAEIDSNMDQYDIDAFKRNEIEYMSDSDYTDENMKRQIPRDKLRLVYFRDLDHDYPSSEYRPETRSKNPRRHLFIGKRNQSKLRGRIHRIFVG